MDFARIRRFAAPSGPVFAIALAQAAAGCGGGGEPAGLLPACLAGFDATVTSGPSAGLSLDGTLVLAQAGSSAAGLLVPHGAQAGEAPVGVTAQIDGQDVTLTFTLADGSSIVGTGSSASTIAVCTGQLQGTLTGPKAGDRGDWLGIDGAIVAWPAGLEPTLDVMPGCLSKISAVTDTQTVIEGTLAWGQADGDVVKGYVVTPSGEVIAMSGTFDPSSGGAVALTFYPASGGTMKAIGKRSASIAACSGTSAGAFTGPTGVAGSWTAQDYQVTLPSSLGGTQMGLTYYIKNLNQIGISKSKQLTLSGVDTG